MHGSILNYACPIWGFSKTKEIERIHLSFCKAILGVKQSTSNAAVYGELARYPLYITRYFQIIKFWLHLLNTDNIIIRYVYNESLKRCLNGNMRTWASKVKLLLAQYGFSDVWDFQDSVLVAHFLPVFKQRLIDCYVQQWRAGLRDNNILNNLYVYIKDEFVISDYLNKIKTKKLRQSLTRIRVSAHTLRIETGRHGRNRIERTQRTCLICGTSDIEDEYHFILKCNAYQTLRLQYIKPYFYRRPSMYKFTQLLNSKNNVTLKNLSKYIYLAGRIRIGLINTLL
jgi:hypothetical protein